MGDIELIIQATTAFLLSTGLVTVPDETPLPALSVSYQPKSPAYATFVCPLNVITLNAAAVGGISDFKLTVILAHEIVHWGQCHRGEIFKGARSCDLEREAYAVAADFAERYGDEVVAFEGADGESDCALNRAVLRAEQLGEDG